MTFWGTKFFKNIKNEEVLYGTTLKTQIFRQVNPEDAKTIDTHIPLGSNTIILVIFCVCIIGAQLPTWMFINSLSLIVHTTLLNSLMPPGVWYVFKKYLNLVRLNSPDLNERIEEAYEVKEYSLDQGLYTIYLKSCDFEHLFARNLVIIIASAILILTVWTLLIVLDGFSRIKQPESSQKRKEPYANNFALRFFYELFLDICICVLVNIALIDFEDFSPGI